MAKIKYTRYVSPKGIAKFVWLDKPDTGFDGKSDPKFKIRLLIDDNKATRAWAEKIVKDTLAEAKAQGVKIKKVFHNPFHFPEDQDEDDFIPAEGKDRPKLDEDHRDKIFFDMKSDFQPSLIDASTAALADGKKIMSGDVVKVKVEPWAYEGLGSGITLRPVTVQLIKKNSSFGGIDKDGFEDEDEYEDDDEDQTDDSDDNDTDDEIPF